VWDAETGEQLHTLRGHHGSVNGVAFSPDGKSLASVSGDASSPGELRVWEVASGRNLLPLEAPACHLAAVAYSRDGRRLAALGSFPRNVEPPGPMHCPGVKVWDTRTGREEVTFIDETADVGRPPQGVRFLQALAFSPDGRSIVSGGGDGSVVFWDLAAGREARRLRGHIGVVTAVAFSQDGARLASAGQEDKTVKIWDVARGQEVLELRRPGRHAISGLTFSPSDGALAAGDWGGALWIWDATPR
jgi:WD40 repeat protein